MHAQVSSLREENDNLKCQLEAYKNEVEVMKSEAKGAGDGDLNLQVKSLQHALQGMQQV